MLVYPTCIHCLKAQSFLDDTGHCTSCSKNASQEISTQQNAVTLNDLANETIDSVEKNADRKDINRTKSKENPEFDFVPAYHPGHLHLSKYEKIEELDRGGMGIIYKAIQKNFDRAVAIKIIPFHRGHDKSAIIRFLKEGKAVAQLAHPGIVQVYDADEENGIHYLAMELVNGASISKMLKDKHIFSFKEIAQIISTTASALALCHKNHILHRDIKSSNILYCFKTKQAKLTDFGLAYFTEDTHQTKSEAQVGTAAFMSPEQANGQVRNISERSDIFSLGATLYEMLTGRPPYDEANAVANIAKASKCDFVPPRKLNPAIPVDLEKIVLRCMEKLPAHRYASASQLANDLCLFLQDKPIEKLTLREKISQTIQKKKKTLVALALLFCLPIIAWQMLPVSYEKQIEQKLNKKQMVELVGPTGFPREFKLWPQSPNQNVLTVRDQGIADQALLYTYTGEGKLELINNKSCNHYTIECELQHVARYAEIGSRFGVYFDIPEEKDKNKETIIFHWTMFHKTYPNKPITQRYHVEACKLIYTESHVNNDYVYKGMVGSKHYSNDDSPIKPWQQVSIEVSSAGLVFNGNNFLPYKDNTTTTRDCNLDVKTMKYWIPGSDPQYAMKSPKWDPKCKIGIYISDASIAIRNVRFIPHE